MPLDPQAELVRQLMAAADQPPLWEVPLADARAGTAALIALQGEAEAVREVRPVTLEGPAGVIPARLYVPEGAGGGALVVYFHGGGWVIGDLDLLDRPCRALANAAAASVVSVDYRLAPEHPFPAAAEDCFAATSALASRAAELGVDPARLVVAGDSAGGNLAAVTCLMARDRGGPPIARQILYCPVTSAPDRFASYEEMGEGYMLTRDTMRWFWQSYTAGDHDDDPMAAPLEAGDLTGLPPALVAVAGYDPLRDEGLAYAEALRRAGVEVTVRNYTDQMHDFLWLLDALPASRLLIAEMAAAVAATAAPVA